MKKRVLIVDDEQTIIDIVKLVLTENGYEAISASSYKTLLPIIYQNKPDVIFMDAMLENEDGRVICQQLKDQSRTKDIRIILISAVAHKLKDHQQFKADGILEKPFSITDLLSTVKLHTETE